MPSGCVAHRPDAVMGGGGGGNGLVCCCGKGLNYETFAQKWIIGKHCTETL